MNNISVWLIIGVVSVIFSIFSRVAAHNEKGKSWWFFEVWRDFVSYFITGFVGYFLVVIRWPQIVNSNDLSIKDFILGIVFLAGALGWLPYLIKNITEGIHIIIKRFIEK